MLFDTLVNSGKTYNRAIDMVLEKCDEAFDHYTYLYDMEVARESYMDYMNDNYDDPDYTYEGFVHTKYEEDYLFKNTKASPGIVGKMVRVIQEAWQNLIRWIKKMIEKIKSVFMKHKVEKKLSLVEKIISKNPFLKKKKIEVPDPKPPLIEKLKNDIKLFKIKLKTGKSFKDIKKELEDIERREALVGKLKTTAKIVIPVTTALILLKQFMDFRAMNKEVDADAPEINETAMALDPEITIGKLKAAEVATKIEKHYRFNIFKFIAEVPKILFHTVNNQTDANENGKISESIIGEIAATKANKTMSKKKALNGDSDDTKESDDNDTFNKSFNLDAAKELLKGMDPNKINNNSTMGTENPIGGDSSESDDDYDSNEIMNDAK
jgi:hypothetical protein